jgi:hypothetical protein
MGNANDEQPQVRSSISLSPMALETTGNVKEVANGWNTTYLGQRLGVDVVAAVTAGLLVAPIVTIIDR